MSRLRKKSENAAENSPALRVPGAAEGEATAEAAPDATPGEDRVDGDGDSGTKRFPRGRIGWDELWRNIKRGKYG